MTVEEALEFAEKNFPIAPEKLADLLKVEVRYSPLNCDGWCLRGRPIIRINSNSPEVRRRFTLAHELGHLILGIPAMVGESMFNVNSKSDEERQVNSLASDILLPPNIVKNAIREIPITASIINEIAQNANVSTIVVARKLASLSGELGLKESVVVFYQEGIYKWHWPTMWRMNKEDAQQLLIKCSEDASNPFRFRHTKENEIVVASTIENPHLKTTLIFLQVVAEEFGLRKLNEELKREFESLIFGSGSEYRASLEGCFSSMKVRINDLSLDESVNLFNDRYLNASNRWDEEFRSNLKSDDGQSYIRLRLGKWVSK